MATNMIVKECLSCLNEIGRRDRTIQCSGLCDKEIHVDCAHITDVAIKVISENDNIQYICDSCASFSLRAINNKLNGIYQYLYDISDKTNKNQVELKEFKKEIIDMNNV